MATWPASLPQDLIVEGYQETPPDTRLVTEMDTGPPKMRQRFTAAPRPFAGSIVVTEAQLATLDAFYTTTLAGGALSFDWKHPRTEAAAVIKFGREKNPIQYEAVDPGVYRVRMSLEVQP